jgi:hypothetical protein
LFERVGGTDVLLLWKILLRHRVCVVDEELFEYRTFLASGGSAHTTDNLAPTVGSRWWRFVAIRLWREMWSACADEKLSPTERRIAKRELVRWLLTPYWRAVIYNDLAAELAAAVRGRRRLLCASVLLAMAVVRPVHSLTLLSNRKVVRAQLKNAADGTLGRS